MAGLQREFERPGGTSNFVRNEGAVGSNPITSTSRTAREHRFRAVSRFGEAFVCMCTRVYFSRSVLSVTDGVDPASPSRLRPGCSASSNVAVDREGTRCE